MDWLWTSYSYWGLTTVPIALAVGVIAWRRRAMPGATSLALMMFAVAEWALTASLERAAVGIPAKVLWSQIAYLGTLTTPVFLLTLALEYNRLYRWLSPLRLGWMFTIPLLMLILAATNDVHHWIWSSYTLSPSKPNLLIYGHTTFAFWGGVVGYSYACVALGTLLMLRALFLYPQRPYLRHTLVMLIGALPPTLSNLVYLSDEGPFIGMDLTPHAFLLSGVLFSWALFRLQWLKLAPVARQALIEHMRDGIVVLDDQHQIVDFNNAVHLMLKGLPTPYAGMPVDALFPHWHQLRQQLAGGEAVRIETTLDGPQQRTLELSIEPLQGPQRSLSGHLLIIHDITQLKRNELELQEANASLKHTIAENEALQASLREQAIRDPLTGLYNRRYLAETLDRELAKAERENRHISLAMLDLDSFKSFNDLYGHPIGDTMLQALAELLLQKTRKGDIACRYGGEEFVVVLPGSNHGNALKRAEEWRLGFGEHPGSVDHPERRATLSVGVATFPEHGVTAATLIGAADRALYGAKQAGRNRVFSVDDMQAADRYSMRGMP